MCVPFLRRSVHVGQQSPAGISTSRLAGVSGSGLAVVVVTKTTSEPEGSVRQTVPQLASGRYGKVLIFFIS